MTNIHSLPCTSKVIVALDFDSKDVALAFVKKLNPSECRIKIGKEMFTYLGPDFVKYICSLGFDVFLDLKFHDIPNTVAKACKAAASLGVWMINVHASGGEEMMKAAKAAVLELGDSRPLLTAVTVLTSMSPSQFDDIDGSKTIDEQVKRLALLAQKAGLDGVVCSAKEAKMLRQVVEPKFLLVTPGIRPAGTDSQDQKRVMTPQEAISSGVDYLVMGRPITQAVDPILVLNSINESIK